MAKIVSIQVEINGIKGAVTDAASLKNALRATNQELGQVEFGTQKYQELQQQLGGLKAVQKQIRDGINDERKAFTASATAGQTSYRALNAQLVNLRNQFRDLSKEERESEIGEQLIKNIGELDSELRELDSTIKLQFRSIGSYGEAILGASKKQEQLVKQLEETRAEFRRLPPEIRASTEAQEALAEITEKLEEDIAQLGKVTGKTAEDYKKGFVANLSETEGAAGDAVRGVQALGASFKALLANPVVAVLSLIVASLSALFGAFTRTKRGADLMAQASAVVSGIISELVGVVDNAVDSIVAFSEDPVQGLKDLGQSLVDNVLNRFKGLIDIVKLSGQALGQLVSGNFTALKNTAEQAAQALIQVSTGLDVQQQNDFADALAGTSREIEKNIDAWAKLGESRRAIFQQNLALQKSLEGIITTEQLLLSVADDTTKSFAEREEAAEKARAASEARASREVQIAQNNLRLVNQELRLRQANGEEVNDLLSNQLSAFQSLSAAERDLTLTIRDNEKTRSELKQDRLERDLDILIDGFDNQKTINERLLQDDRITLDERQALFEETARLADESFQRQIETIQQFTGVRVNANQLISESDTIRLNEQIRALGLSEIIEGRLLEVIRERRLAVQDLTEAETTLNEEAANVPIQQIEAARDLQLAALAELGSLAEELSNERELIESRANKSILDERLKDENLNAAERAALELQLAEQIAKIRKQENEGVVGDEVALIEARRNERLRAALAEVGDAQDTAKKIAAIQLEADVEILQARLDLAELTDDQRLALELELQQQRIDAALSADQQIADNNKRTFEAIESGLQSLQSLQNVLALSSEARTNREISAINRRYEGELELAEGNDEEIRRIEEERDEALATVQEEAFERGKKLQKAQALISGAQAILSVLAAVPGPLDIASLGIARILQIGFTLATTAAQIAVIDSQEFQGADGLLIPEMSNGGTVGMHTTAKGRSHASGHIFTQFHGQPVRIENGEWVTDDEFGNAVVINKRSSRKHHNLLNAVSRRSFSGKGAMLSAINQDGGGIPLGEDGLMVGPNLTPFFMNNPQGPQATNVTVMLSDGQMQQLGAYVAQGAAAGTKQGTEQGAQEAEKMKERRQSLNSRTR